MLIQNNINLWHFSRWVNALLASPQCCRHQVMDRDLRANIKIKICHLNHSMNVPYLNFWHLIYSNSEPMLVAVFVGDWYAGENVAMNYSIIWFLKPRLRSLCGRTIELRITTSDGMLTLQPGGTKKKKTRMCLGGDVLNISITLISRFPPWPFTNQYILIKTSKNGWAVSSHLPRMVIEGVSFPSMKRVSLSIFAYGSLGFGSLGVPSTLAHFPMVLSHPTMLFKTQEWSWKNIGR